MAEEDEPEDDAELLALEPLEEPVDEAAVLPSPPLVALATLEPLEPLEEGEVLLLELFEIPVTVALETPAVLELTQAPPKAQPAFASLV